MTDSKGRCLCGCGQKPSSSCRERKVQCPGCGYVSRITRTWIARGMSTCPCGAVWEPVCLFDRAFLPGSEGDAALELATGMVGEFDRRSVNARKAITRRRRCKVESCGALVGKGELYCRNHVHEGMAF